MWLFYLSLNFNSTFMIFTTWKHLNVVLSLKLNSPFAIFAVRKRCRTYIFFEKYKQSQLNNVPITRISLERRWSSRTFRYGYLVTTSPQSLVLPSAASSLAGWITDFGSPQLPWCDGRCVQDPGTHSPRHADSRLLVTPTSCRRVAAYNPNWDRLIRIRSRSLLRCPLYRPL